MTEQLIPLNLIDPNPYQPRHSENPEDVIELAQDILHHANEAFDGLLQVPTVRAAAGGRYQLAFGHTRKAAFDRLFQDLGNDRYGRMRANVHELSDVQMFELAVAENIKRRDLNPIEQAEAMRRYMDEFHKTSVEAGGFFGVAEETIRQKVRYIKLPEPVKEKMRNGSINENTGRALLSMQKIASEQVVIKTVEHIEKNQEDATPEQVIEQVVDRLDTAVEMWPAHRDGKPRSGSGGWLLDMKNFPNKLLPAMTEEAVGTYESQIEHLADPPSCTACPYYTRIRGSHYCGLKICHTRKTIAWERHQVEQASKQLKIALYEAEDGAYVALRSYEPSNIKLFEKRHERLRLIGKSQIGNRSVWQSGFRGVDNDLFYVVATGDAISKLGSGSSVKSNVGKKSEAEKAEMRRMKVYRMRRKQMMWECTAIAKSMFDGVPLEVLRKLSRWNNIMIDDRIPDEYDVPENGKADASAKVEFQRRALVWRLIMDNSSYYRRTTMLSIVDGLQKLTQIKPPKSLIKMAEEWDAEVKAAGERKVGK